MALAFVIRHPAVTAAIIGPRTMEHLESQLGAADVELSDDVLDRIDEIVPPGVERQPDRRRLAQPGARAGGAAPLAMLLSVLDQSPISEGSTGAHALRNTLDLAELADALGYHRYWVAEHHGTPVLACAAPEVLIGAIAAAHRSASAWAAAA